MNNFSYLLSLILLVPLTTFPIRHSKIKKNERREMRASAIKTDDEQLREILYKQTKNMSFDDATKAKNYYLKEKVYDMAIKCGQRLLAVSGDQDVMRTTRLELAELFLDRENYAEAERYAMEYQKYYPGADEAIRAEYIAIRANYLSKLTSHRDQAKTKNTIRLAEEFLEKHPHDKLYAQSVKDMQHACYLTLIRSEINIITTHLHTFRNTRNEKVLAAAQQRVDYIKKNYLAHAPSTKKRVDELELKVALAGKRPETALKVAHIEQQPIVAHKKRGTSHLLKDIKRNLLEDNEEYFA